MKIKRSKGKNIPETKGFRNSGIHSQFSIISAIPTTPITAWQSIPRKNYRFSFSIVLSKTVPFMISIQYSSGWVSSSYFKVLKYSSGDWSLLCPCAWPCPWWWPWPWLWFWWSPWWEWGWWGWGCECCSCISHNFDKINDNVWNNDFDIKIIKSIAKYRIWYNH